MAELQAVLWDFDGTIFDTEPIWEAVEHSYIREHGGEIPADFAERTVGGSVLNTAEVIASCLLDPAPVREIAESIVDAMCERFATMELPWLPGAQELMADLQAAGVPQVLVSSSWKRILTTVLQRLDSHPFHVVVGGDQVQFAKPHPAPYQQAANRLKLRPENCLVIEDSPNGAASGNAAGCIVLAVPSVQPPPAARRRVVRESLEGLDAAALSQLFQEATNAEFNPSGVRSGALEIGERVALVDMKGRRHSILLTPGKVFHTTKGGIAHDEIIGGPEGVVVTSTGGMQFVVWRPLMFEFTVSMPRGAAVIYPKDQGQIITWADIYPGARVLEAGVGSGALSMALLRAIGPTGHLSSYERREEFAEVAQANVEWFFSGHPSNWDVTVGDLVEAIRDEEIDRAVLDMLAPWECVDAVAERLRAGGMLCCYVATTTQLARTMDQIRAHGGFAEPTASETIARDWHAEGLAVRPGHGAGSHTGFLIFARRLAPGVTTPMKKRRPAPGAYGADYTGPRPFGMADPEPVVEEIAAE